MGSYRQVSAPGVQRLVLAVGLVDAGGKFSIEIPGVVLPPGNPNAFILEGVTIDPANLAFRLTPPVQWPTN